MVNYNPPTIASNNDTVKLSKNWTCGWDSGSIATGLPDYSNLLNPGVDCQLGFDLGVSLDLPVETRIAFDKAKFRPGSTFPVNISLHKTASCSLHTFFDGYLYTDAYSGVLSDNMVRTK